MVEACIIQDALQQHLSSNQLNNMDHDMLDYLESVLQEDDAYDDLEALAESILPFLQDDTTVAQALVQTIAQKSKNNASDSQEATAEGTTKLLVKEQPLQQEDTDSSDNSSSSSSTDSKSKNNKTKATKKATRKEQRRKKKEEKQRNRSKSPKISTTTTATTTNKSTDIHAVVQRLQAHSAMALNDMDDYSSAWDQVKSDSNQKVWGGRGYGGRGVNRGLATSQQKDAVVQNMTLSYGGQELLHSTHLAISHKHRYGLVGPNGCGKSTLLKRMASQSIPGWPLHLTVQMVEQEVLGTSQTVLEAMVAVRQRIQGATMQRKQQLEEDIAELEAILEDANTDPEELESTAERLSDLYDQLDTMENESTKNNTDSADQLDAKANKILKGLQFQESMFNTKGNLLSGGWRMRLALAQALYSEPDILLLDEPTNHLDLSAVLFLEQYIVDHDMTVVVVSHDGHFLDAICTDMIKFQPNRKLQYHVGNFSSLREMEEQTWARNTKKAEAAAKKEKKTKEFIQKQRSMANSKHRDDNKQKQAAERQKKLGRIGLYSENGQKFKLLAEGNTKKGGANRAGHIFGNYTNARGMQSFFVSNEKVAFGEDQQLLSFKFPSAAPLKGAGAGSLLPLIAMEDCRFRYNADDDWLLRDMSLNVTSKSRIAIVGKNGAGKSTLLKLLCGELQVGGGEYHIHPNVRVAHIAQHHIEHLGSFLECTPVEYFLQQHHAKNEQEARQFLGGFGLVGSLALQLIGTLSGGQKARLAFATVMYTQPHVLILDEPTNHLDRDSLESLSVAVEKFEGAVITVSHNQDFLSRCANEMWTVANGNVKVEVADGELTSFNDLFERYKEDLRRDLRKQK